MRGPSWIFLLISVIFPVRCSRFAHFSFPDIFWCQCFVLRVLFFLFLWPKKEINLVNDTHKSIFFCHSDVIFSLTPRKWYDRSLVHLYLRIQTGTVALGLGWGFGWACFVSFVKILVSEHHLSLERDRRMIIAVNFPI